jgi:hypothetical protein
MVMEVTCEELVSLGIVLEELEKSTEPPEDVWKAVP